jgi:hypothetical protein
MPQGVEHLICHGTVFWQNDVRIPLMPQGVEHADDWRAAFPRGCRVEVDLERLAEVQRICFCPPYTGTVRAHARASDGRAGTGTVWVQLDGRKRTRAYYVQHLRRLEAAP